jgi:hypothetical protein
VKRRYASASIVSTEVGKKAIAILRSLMSVL